VKLAVIEDGSDLAAELWATRPPVATVSEEMVSLARERAPGAEVVVGRAEQLPFADADFWAHRYNVRGVRLCVLANVELVRMSPPRCHVGSGRRRVRAG